MTVEQITALLRTTGLPVAYRCFKGPVQLPYLVWMETRTANFFADGTVYSRIRHVTVELYTDEKEPDTEASVERALASFAWEKTEEIWLESEKCFENLYEFEV